MHSEKYIPIFCNITVSGDILPRSNKISGSGNMPLASTSHTCHHTSSLDSFQKLRLFETVKRQYSFHDVMFRQIIMSTYQTTRFFRTKAFTTVTLCSQSSAKQYITKQFAKSRRGGRRVVCSRGSHESARHQGITYPDSFLIPGYLP